MPVIDFRELRRVILTDFADIVVHVEKEGGKLRAFIIDGSYVDFWWSEVSPGRFAYHWERRHINGTIFRHDNSPHLRWRHLKTFPLHFHAGSDENVVESKCPQEPMDGVRFFLEFCREFLSKKRSF